MVAQPKNASETSPVRRVGPVPGSVLYAREHPTGEASAAFVGIPKPQRTDLILDPALYVWTQLPPHSILSLPFKTPFTS